MPSTGRPWPGSCCSSASALAPLDAIVHLVGLQSQNPLDPYLSLWSRLERFDPDEVGRLVEDRALVRIVVMRGTIHLVTAADACTFRPLTQPVLDAEIARHSEFAEHLVGVDMAPVLAFAHPLLSERPMAGRQLRAALAERFPDEHAAALAYACRCLLPLVQVPPRGVWGKTLQVTSTPVDAWVGHPLDPSPSIDEVVLRYLEAFGPATPADAMAWSRLTGLREVFDRLRPQLRIFHDERGRELYDRPDAPRPTAEVPAPVRFLPEYDNLLLSHADRTRFSSEDADRLARATGPARGTVLVDGRVAAVWHSELDRSTGAVALVVEHVPLTAHARSRVEAEGRRAARFWHPSATAHEVRLLALA